MSVMPETLKRHVGNDWLPTEATITACEQTLLGQEEASPGVRAIHPRNTESDFSYAGGGVDGRVLEGELPSDLPAGVRTPLRDSLRRGVQCSPRVKRRE